jgi:hypothetical protein
MFRLDGQSTVEAFIFTRHAKKVKKQKFLGGDFIFSPCRLRVLSIEKGVPRQELVVKSKITHFRKKI